MSCIVSRTPFEIAIAFDPGAAKTGTAEHGADPKNTPPHGWYVAFAPAGNPQVAIAVVLEQQLNGFGGAVSAPIAKQVMQAILAR